MRCAACDLLLIGPDLCLFCGDLSILGRVAAPTPGPSTARAGTALGRSKPIRPSLVVPVGLGVCLFGLLAACGAVVAPSALASDQTNNPVEARSSGGFGLHTAGLATRGQR